jgi:hypothetical protein
MSRFPDPTVGRFAPPTVPNTPPPSALLRPGCSRLPAVLCFLISPPAGGLKPRRHAGDLHRPPPHRTKSHLWALGFFVFIIFGFFTAALTPRQPLPAAPPPRRSRAGLELREGAAPPLGNAAALGPLLACRLGPRRSCAGVESRLGRDLPAWERRSSGPPLACFAAPRRRVRLAVPEPLMNARVMLHAAAVSFD